MIGDVQKRGNGNRYVDCNTTAKEVALRKRLDPKVCRIWPWGVIQLTYAD